MAITIAFDVYGTLIDTHGVVSLLEGMIGEMGAGFSRAWREKQLEYSFRRGLMQNYADFSVCTRQALEFTCASLRVELSAAQKDELMALYRTLPPFADVASALEELAGAGFRLFAFSNGTAAAVEGLLAAAGIRGYFEGVVSVDDLRSFKPNPGVYAHFLRAASVRGAEAWLVSGNPFDVIGAISAGMKGAWVQRSPEAIFDPWGIDPHITVSGLGELPARLRESRG